MKTLAITSGKGGVGKSSLTANIAYSLALCGRRVAIFDADFGLGSIEILFGKKSEGSIAEFIAGQKSLDEVMISPTPFVTIIPAGSGLSERLNLTAFDRRNLMDSVAQLEHRFDYLIVDTAPGISDNVMQLASSVQMTVVVLNPEPTSFADSYSLIKLLHREFKENRFHILCNQSGSEFEGLQMFNRFNEVVHRFLPISLEYVGSLPYDMLYKKATQNHRLIMRHEPKSKSAEAIREISNKIEKKFLHLPQRSGLQMLFQQIVGVA